MFFGQALSSLDSLFSVSDEEPSITQAAQRGGLIAFIYLEILDASFSFDGVIGAFAITQDLPIIMLGLGIGALYVRSLTVYLVNRGTLDKYIYLGGCPRIAEKNYYPDFLLPFINSHYPANLHKNNK